jgi:glutaredoxin-related protein
LFPTQFTSHSPNILNKATTPITNITLLQQLDFQFDKYTSWKTLKQSQITGDYDTKYEGEFV